MKSTDRQLFLRHQRRCVKCQQLKQVRAGQVVDHDVLVLLQLHEGNMGVLYGPWTGDNALDPPPGDLPGD